MISIVIPLYNKESQIANTLNSVLTQSYQDFEIVIVDDGSTDGSIAEVRKIQDPRIRIVSQKNAGVSAARNRGIVEAKGEYIAFLDADDEWKSDYLTVQAALIEKYPECKVFATNYEFRNANGIVRPTILNGMEIPGESGIFPNYFQVAAISAPPLWTSAVVVEKSAIEGIGGFPEGIKSGEDLLTWARLGVKYPIAYCKVPHAYFVNDEQVFNEDQRKRAPESFDYVGEELKKLYHANPHVKGLKQYVGLWHKMRSRIFLNKHQRRAAIREAYKSMKYAINSKIVVFLMLGFMPYPIVDFVFKKIG